MPETYRHEPLSVGNVVSAGLRIYRDHFKLYYSLAFRAYLWILIPIYGWAKFSALSGAIARLAFHEVLERPESSREAWHHVDPRKWSFFLQGILLSLIYFAFLFVILILFIVAAVGVGQFVTVDNVASILFAFLLGMVGFFLFIFASIWLASRLYISPLPLAIEDDMTATGAIARSWELTSGSVFRIQGIILVAILVTFPVSLVVQVVSQIVQVIIVANFPPDSVAFNLLSFLFIIALSFISGALFLPFWQSIAAIIYYDLRTRREGLGLELRDS
ncbi:MAG: glycerophosphoryl diester phosphodiesterase membrane domain-containing protein [Limnospira sp.]